MSLTPIDIEDYLDTVDALQSLVGPSHTDLVWQEQALCAETDQDAFFPDKGESARPGKSICKACPVRLDCLEYALRKDEHFGIWGGLTRKERIVLGRARDLRAGQDAA